MRKADSFLPKRKTQWHLNLDGCNMAKTITPQRGNHYFVALDRVSGCDYILQLKPDIRRWIKENELTGKIRLIYKDYLDPDVKLWFEDEDSSYLTSLYSPTHFLREADRVFPVSSGKWK